MMTRQTPVFKSLNSFDLAFLILRDTLFLQDLETTCIDVLKASKDVSLWGPESVLLFSVLYKEWINQGGLDFTDKLIAAFDTSGDISVDSKRIETTFKEYNDIGKKIWEKTDKKVFAIFKTVCNSATRYFSKQSKKTKKTKKDDTLDKWKLAIKGASAKHIRKFIESYPERFMHPQTKKLAEQALKNPNFRMIDRFALKERINKISKVPKAYIKDVSDIHAGRVWNFTGLIMARAQKVKEFQIISMLDNLTCPVCMRLHGTRFTVEIVYEKMRNLLGEDGNEKALIKAFPFPRIKDVDNVSAEQKRSLQTMPPFHGKCRCDVVMLWASTESELPELPKIETIKNLAELKNLEAEGKVEELEKELSVKESFIEIRDRLEEGIAFRNTEKAYVMDKYGNISVTQEGSRKSVTFTQKDVDNMVFHSILTHNHPTEASFSPADIFCIFKMDLGEVRAVTANHTHSMIPNWKVWNKKFSHIKEKDKKQAMVDYILKEYTKSKEGQPARTQKLIKQGKLRIGKRTYVEQYHLIMVNLAENVEGLTYLREEAPWSIEAEKKRQIEAVAKEKALTTTTFNMKRLKELENSRELKELEKERALKESFATKVERLEEGIAYDLNEKSYLFDSAGNLIFVKEGKENFVQFDSEELREFPDGMIGLHNHPGINAGSFSQGDLNFAFTYRQQEERAVTMNYLHTFKIDWKVFDAEFDSEGVCDMILEAYEETWDDVSLMIKKNINAGVMSLEFGNDEHAHMVMTQLAKEIDGLSYSRKVR